MKKDYRACSELIETKVGFSRLEGNGPTLQQNLHQKFWQGECLPKIY